MTHRVWIDRCRGIGILQAREGSADEKALGCIGDIPGSERLIPLVSLLRGAAKLKDDSASQGVVWEQSSRNGDVEIADPRDLVHTFSGFDLSKRAFAFPTLHCCWRDSLPAGLFGWQ
jgi:hypothetical protein